VLNAILIGFGYWGPNIAKNLKKSSEYNLIGICDINENAIIKDGSVDGGGNAANGDGEAGFYAEPIVEGRSVRCPIRAGGTLTLRIEL
jgi:hypothetical protein